MLAMMPCRFTRVFVNDDLTVADKRERTDESEMS
jgi:hypothetical protein